MKPPCGQRSWSTLNHLKWQYGSRYVSAINLNFKNKFTDKFHDVCKLLGIDGCLHSLRHSQAIITYLETGDVMKVKKKLNHQQISTTDGYANMDELVVVDDFKEANAIGVAIDNLRKKVETDKFHRQNEVIN